MSSQTAAAATRTESQVGTPNMPRPLAMPANSEKVVQMLPMSRASMASAVGLMPNFSRISAAKPLPVTAPILPAVSCTTAKSRHMMGMIHSDL